MKTALLIGGTGFIGRNLARTLCERGYDVVTSGRNPATDATDATDDGSRSISLDLQDAAQVDAVFRAVRPDIVFHLACNLLPASTRADYFHERRTLIEPSMALVERLAADGTLLVFLSSGGTIYGRVEGDLITEDQECRPINYYGHAKLEFEAYLHFAERTMGLRHLIVRPSNPYGPGQSLHGAQGLIAVLIGKALRGDPLDVWGDGSTVRDYIHVDDLCTSILHLVEREHGHRVFNIGSGIGHSLLDVTTAVERAIGHSIALSFHPARSVDLRRAVLDIARLTATGAPPARLLYQGIDAFVAHVNGGTA